MGPQLPLSNWRKLSTQISGQVTNKNTNIGRFYEGEDRLIQADALRFKPGGSVHRDRSEIFSSKHLLRG